MEFEDPEIVDEFVVESTEHLADIENQLLSIEASGADIDVDLVNTVFRGVHSIKGAAGFLGLTSINELAHSLENVLNLMREGELVPTSAIADVMLRASDELRELLENVADSNDVDVSQYVCQLEAIANGSPIPDTEPVEESPEPAESESDSESEADDPLAAAELLIAAMAAEGATSIDGLKSAPQAKPADKPRGKAGKKQTNKTDAAPAKPANEPAKSKQQPKKPAGKATKSPKAAKKKATKEAAATGKSGSASSGKAPAESSIRVSIESLDRLMNLAGELVLGRNQLLQTIATGEAGGLEEVSAKVNQVTAELQDAIMQTRMQPIGNVFTRFNRVVRDLSAKLDKQCELVIEGKDVEVDKTIVEAIADPLTHLVRNAIDHGLESPATREANGKVAQGTLHLRAFHQSGKVCIEIADDGSGIDVDVIKAKAVEKGVVSIDQVEEMSDRDAYRLILMPGFSTAETLSDVSGRGVGMDVVRTNIERLGGTVEIDSQLGSGTTIQVTLPLTLAIIPSLMVRCGQERFAIPQVNISELVRLRDAEIAKRIEKVNGAEVLRLRGTLLPLVRLRDALGERAEEDSSEQGNEAVNLIVVETGQMRYGLIVDGLFDSEEIVVKPLGRHLSDCPCLSGATILGDGRVALILDVNGIAMQSKLKSDDSSSNSDTGNEEAAESTAQSVLLFTNHPDEHFAVPMELIARIERIQSDKIVRIGSEELFHYRQGSLPLLRLENIANAKPGPDLERCYIVVFEAAGREVGILATSLIDIRDVSDQFDPTTFDDPGIAGSQVIDEQTTRLLDTVELARQARPDWFESTPSKPTVPSDRFGVAASEPSGTPWAETDCILLAEDSSFFRRQVKGFLEDSGYEVVDCEDGREALSTLHQTPERFNIVLTDIEMPNMDGLEFTRAIRSENRFAELPIIALTSLASQEDFQRGFDAGVTEYQVKLDRDKLIAAIGRFATNRSPDSSAQLVAT